MEQYLAFIEQVILGNSLRDWLLALAAFGATFLILPFIRSLIRKRQQRWKDMHNPALELLSLLAARTNRLVLLSVALYFAEKLLALPPAVDRVFDVIIVVGVAIQFALWAATALRFGIERHYRRGGAEPSASAAVGVLMFVGQVVIWALFVLLALDNLGINITALVAGMGIGGITIALAVQTILGDLFGSMSIALDKPFAVGDQLRIDDVEGTVEHIGIKSTRLRSVTGEQVIIANADVLKSRVRNLGRMAERRVQLRFGVTYDTPPARLEEVSELVREAVQGVPHTRFLQCPLVALGADSLEYEVIYYIDTRSETGPGLTTGEINKAIFRKFAAAGIGFAYPTRRLLVEQVKTEQLPAQ